MRELFNSETGTPAIEVHAVRRRACGPTASTRTGAATPRPVWTRGSATTPTPDLGDPASASLTTADGHRAAGRPDVLPGLPAVAALRVVPRVGPPRRLHRRRDGRGRPGTGAVRHGRRCRGPTVRRRRCQAYSPAFPNQWAGRKAFAGDSFGWTAQPARPVVVRRADGEAVVHLCAVTLRTAIIGWWLDDIVVYTCDVAGLPTSDAAPPRSDAPRSRPRPTPTTPAPTQGRVDDRSSRSKTRSRQGDRSRRRSRPTGAKATGKVTFKVMGKKNMTKTVKVKKGKATLVLHEARCSPSSARASTR